MKKGDARRGGRVFGWSWEPLYQVLPNAKQLQRKNSWKCEDDVGELFSGYERTRVSRISYNPVAAVLILTVFWVYLYWESLVGGDLRTVVHSLGQMAVSFFLAIACFLAAVYITLFDPTIPGRLRAVLLGGILISLHLLFLFDHGGSLRHHGAYNMLMFVIFVAPALVIAALEYALWRVLGTSAVLALHVPAVLYLLLSVDAALQDGAEVWDRGFFGERMQPLNRSCALVNRGLTWVDIFPEGSQNFGASTFTCGDLEQEAAAVGFSVNFTADGVLSATCSADRGMTYTPLPSTTNWRKEDKLIEETYEGLLPRPFNKNVMDRVREAGVIDYEVGIPIRLPLETEAVIMRCAHVEKLVTRVRPIPSVSSRVKPEGLDVVVIFLDATSRRAFHRRLRETEAVMEDAHARGVTSLYQFFRYNVVEFCTEPNTRAMFQSTTALQNATVPPVWEAFRASGYATLFTADTCQDLAAAYMNRNSSHNTSSFDHELFAPFCHADFFAEDANPFGNFKGPCSITARCFKSEQVHEHELRYLASLRGAYPDRATLSIGWFLEGHEGTTEVLRNLDGGLASYFRGVDWNSTAVIVAADHGLHMGLNFGVAQNGAVEHKNPFMAMMLPPWFVARRGRHQALHTNQQRVVTAFDLCKTLHALRVAGLDRDPWVDPGTQYRVLNTSMDLLHEEVLRIGPVKKLELALNGANACSIISMELT